MSPFATAEHCLAGVEVDASNSFVALDGDFVGSGVADRADDELLGLFHVAQLGSDVQEHFQSP